MDGNTTWRGLPAEVLARLRCPACGGDLNSTATGLACSGCPRTFPFLRGVVRFVDSEKYVGNFGFQWQKYARTQLDDAGSHFSEETFRRKTGFTPEDLRGKWVLDVGCGMGRYAEVVSRWGAYVVGIDLSQAAEVAAQNLADRPTAALFQADIFSLPFAPESFDYMYSIGVLHHTPNCEAAFRALPPFLKPGGRIAIWLYSGYNRWYRFSDVYRRLTTRLPQRWLHALCQIVVPLYHIHRVLRAIPLVGRPASGLIGLVLPVSLHARKDFRVLDTFDWYSPVYQSKHTYEEVFRWFESCGLDSLRVLHVPVAVQGRKPSVAREREMEEAKCVASPES